MQSPNFNFLLIILFGWDDFFSCFSCLLIDGPLLLWLSESYLVLALMVWAILSSLG